MAHLDLVQRLFYIRRTSLNMLKARGYAIGGEADGSLEDFKSKFGDNPDRKKLTIFRHKKDDPTDQIFVFFASEQKLGITTVKEFVSKMKKDSVRNAILVVPGIVSGFARTAINEISSSFQMHITYFQESELLVDITEHMLVPEHIKLSQSEKKELLNRYKLKDSQLPRIQVTDPVAKYYGLERGEVVKICRTSETAGRYITYRLVA